MPFGAIPMLIVVVIGREVPGDGSRWPNEPFCTQKGTPASLGDAGVPRGRSRMGGVRSPTSLEQRVGTESSSLRDLRTEALPRPPHKGAAPARANLYPSPAGATSLPVR
jgi:hypothetical protein